MLGAQGGELIFKDERTPPSPPPQLPISLFSPPPQKPPPQNAMLHPLSLKGSLYLNYKKGGGKGEEKKQKKGLVSMVNLQDFIWTQKEEF